jgi:hypothetical protein
MVNQSLYRLHRVLLVAYVIGATLLGLAGLNPSNGIQLTLFVLAISLPAIALHYFAARGVRQGKTYGKTLSIVFAVLAFIGFPIGTALSIYVFCQLGSKWENAQPNAA